MFTRLFYMLLFALIGGGGAWAVQNYIFNIYPETRFVAGFALGFGCLGFLWGHSTIDTFKSILNVR